MEDKLKNLVEQTRKALVDYRIKTEVFRPEIAPMETDLAGLCGTSAYALVNAFTQANLSSQIFCVQSLPECNEGHAAVSLILGDGNCYLVDPTFVQFKLLNTEPPISRLEDNGEEGKLLLNSLLEDGFFQVTNDTAMLYVSSFYSSQPNFSNADAFNYLKNPPYCESIEHAVNTEYGDIREATPLQRMGLEIKF